jgi:hypothetical protein
VSGTCMLVTHFTCEILVVLVTCSAIGDIETETASLLVEHDIEAPPFSQAQCAELPVDTPEAPWVMVCVRLWSVTPKVLG